MPQIQPPNAPSARPPVLPPKKSAANKAVPVDPESTTGVVAATDLNGGVSVPVEVDRIDTVDVGRRRPGRAPGSTRGPEFKWNQERVDALVTIVVGGARSAVEVQQRLSSHPTVGDDDSALLTRESILRRLKTIRQQLADSGQPDLAEQLELSDSHRGWKPDLARVASIIQHQGAGTGAVVE